MTEETQAATPPEEPKKKARWHAPVKLIAISAVSILLGCGLCSVGGLRLEGDSIHPVVVGIGTAAFWGGILGLGVGVLWWLIALISSSGTQGRPQ
jgi:hypothetical protein